MNWKIIILLLLFTKFSVQAQLHQPVFPNLSGLELLDSLVRAYKPNISLPQALGRDTLFAKIYNHNDSLTCVYTGYTIWLDPAQDPTQAAFQGGGPDAINTEHTYPQSLGASGVADGDLHHLYPSRADVNAARGNSPFAEIPDDQTEKWYYLDQQQSTIPTANIDLYSERKGALFEPREDHKGNVARAMFYFYTMYKEQADMASTTFFETQRQTLCNWHFLDPADDAEWRRTWLIAHYQDAKPNPFILDCSLPERTYCGDSGQHCATGIEEESKPGGVELAQNSPNPFGTTATFSWKLKEPCLVRLEIFNSLGQKVATPFEAWQNEGGHEFVWQNQNVLDPGLAYYRLVMDFGERLEVAAKKMMVAR